MYIPAICTLLQIQVNNKYQLLPILIERVTEGLILIVGIIMFIIDYFIR